MAKILIVTQARLQSTRLPKKILKEINGKSLLRIHLKSLSKSKYYKNLVVATTMEKGIKKIIDCLKRMSIKYYQGSVHDVLDRYYRASLPHNPDYIVRVTSDCPLIDASLMDEIIDYAIDKNVDYVSNNLIEQYPDGQDVEIISANALQIAWERAESIHDRENVTPFIKNNSTFFGHNLFTSENFSCNQNYNHIRMTVDEQSDFDAIKVLINNLGFGRDWGTYTRFIDDNQYLFKNQQIIRNEGSKL
tara:strand:+ start:2363 stop:3103 length:741 start_codon:yes stop_codon:yes gene_type:complete